ncbi:MAG: cell division protein FtsZ [Lentimicrobiaceae bacterium]|nr:cell division protein FtsZ [Lentimicrobiaceae bacterium]
MTELINFDTVVEMPNIIKVIGVGGGGGNAVTHMFTEGIQGVDFILCNTDKQALEKSPVANKIHLGKRLLGAGNKPEEGHKAAIETTDELREILSKDTKMLFITAGMGGGTGTGAAPVVAEIARELDILTVGIVTLPFSFEGKRRQQQAQLGIEELRKHVDALLVISNDKLRQEHGDMKLTQAFKKADDVLKTAAKGIAEIITVTGYVNVDFKDVNTVMRDSGKAIMGSGYAEGENRATKAVEEAVHSPLLDDSDIRGAKNILVYITSGTEEVTLDEVTDITEYVQEATGNCSDVIWGNGEDMSLGKGLNVTLIATGFEYQDDSVKVHVIEEERPKNRLMVDASEPQRDEKTNDNDDFGRIEVINKSENKVEEKEREKETEKETSGYVVHSLYNEDENDDEHYSGDRNNRTQDRNIGSTDRNIGSATYSSKSYSNPFGNDDDDDNIGLRSYIKDSSDANAMTMQKHEVKSKNNGLSQQEQLRRQRLASLNMNFRSMSHIEEMENQPAYKRMGINISNEDNEQLSHYSSKKDMGLREGNSFLHDNVD